MNLLALSSCPEFYQKYAEVLALSLPKCTPNNTELEPDSCLIGAMETAS